MHDLDESVREHDPEVYEAVLAEEQRQKEGVELIPSENYTYAEVLAVLGSVFTNKYSEGYPGARYYGGQKNTDIIENLARTRACALFGADHANVQALSGAAMNQAAYYALLKPGDRILAMDLSHGGHLTHGAPVSHMSRIFEFHRYRTLPDQAGAIDFDEVERLAKELRPKLLLCGYSSYPRDLDYGRFKVIADSVGALTMADVSHIGGLIAAGVMNNPVAAGFDVVTTTTHKTLRGPRGGLILCRAPFAKIIDQGVFPGLQGGPHMNAIAGIAITLKRAAEPSFKRYGQQVLDNAKVLARALIDAGGQLVTGGTDNHMMVLNTKASFGITGREAEGVLDRVSLTVNRQVVPDDPEPPLRASGIRLGTPAATTRGMGKAEMVAIAGWIVQALRKRDDRDACRTIREEVETMCRGYEVPGLAVRP